MIHTPYACAGGGFTGRAEKLLPEERKAELKSFYEEHKMYGQAR